ncbi:TAT-variant-translocated molybdopterin oxidoreductase [Tundrisphaera lichenicola]|uniref:TAT-variant-translocated molybdopterin oxidoreductase n=1 Tax=Tundrisphaera lichenicola TaxID=2029860 RepID=UPI003EBF48D1
MRTPRENPGDDLVEIRAELAKAKSGAEYWRSLEELAGTERFQHFLHREFPENATELANPESRRTFLKVMGASLALAGVSGCAIRTPEKIVSWAKSPEQVVPGRPQFFATSMTSSGLGTGLVVESHSGRPTKIEGNPDHPASLGSTDLFAQAETLNLYDPDRSKVVLHEGQVGTWDDFLGAIGRETTRLKGTKGAGLRILTEAVGSPSLAGQIKQVLAAFPEAKWHRYESVNADNAHAGSKLAFGEVADPVYHFDRADVILSLDADFLACGAPGRTSDERAFAAKREPKQGSMNRLYVAEGAFTNTGASADHRLPIRPGLIVELALAIAKAAGVEGAPEGNGLTEAQAKFAAAVGRDLKAHSGKALVLVGESQPAYVHALGLAINQAVGAIGSEGTVHFIDPIEVDPVSHADSLRELVADMNAGKVETLLILGGNPAYSSPADLDFAGALKKVAFSGHLGLYDDETSQRCDWHIPAAHFLESWGDARSFDGTASIVQPLIAPLYDGKTAHEVLAVLINEYDKSPLRVVMEYWRGRAKPDSNFDVDWRTALNRGVVEGTAAAAKTLKVQEIGAFGTRPSSEESELEVLFRPDPNVRDGRYANNGWLQELPRPITKLTWDNAALVGTGTAAKLLGLAADAPAEKLVGSNGRMARIKYKGRTLEIPIWIVPGQAEGTVVVHLGYGRTRAGRVGTGPGFNANVIRTSDAPSGGPGASVTLTSASYKLVSTQMTRSLEGRDHVRVANLSDFLANPGFVNEEREHSEESLAGNYEPEYDDHYRWGMAIDLNSCTGCNACVVACQAENNIAVIGKEEVAIGRSMQWMEIDNYFAGAPESPDAYFQPRTCMHCENAPCELVCPVAATVHDAEGLNVMVYNRCVGTRYCGNNCPYKVRHFNFLEYSDLVTPSLKLLNNPDVTIRSRGVMEKCTYCIQRISGARINAKEEGRKIKDGEVVTACQSACPARAIHFGDLNDKTSKVSQIKSSERDYAMLGELNTRPRTTYLGKVRNPNPELLEA